MAGTDSAKRKSISIDEAAGLLARKANANERLAGGEGDAPCVCADQKDDEQDLAAASFPEDEAADADGAETRTGREDEADEEGEAEDGKSEQAPLEPPKFWDAKAKERFGALPRDVQEIILRKEDERNAATARALQETAEKRKAAEADGARLSQLMRGLDLVLSEVADNFRGRWHNIDWNGLPARVGAEKALAMRNQHDTDMRRIQQLKSAKDASELLSLRNHVAREEAMLPAVSPELADPAQGGVRRAALARFLSDLGMPADRLTRLSALEAAIAYDAMKWRNGQSQAEALAKAKPATQARRTPAKPTAAAGPRTTHQARIGALSRKRELSIEEAVELANLERHLMTAITHTATTLTTKGIREDLEDTIYRVAPTKTPFQNNIGNGGKATNTYHEWQVEAPDTPSGSNYQLEGDDISSFDSENVTSRVGNYCQIFRKTGLVSGTDEVVKKAGRASELNRQKVLKGIALRTDMEMTFLSNLGSGAESGGTPRKCAGLPAWITTNYSVGATGAVSGFSSSTVTAATPGTSRTFTEALFKSVRATAFNNGATPNQCYVGSVQKQEMSAFTGIASIRVDAKPTEQATIIGAADVYVDDFGTVAIIPHQYAVSGMAILVDPNMVGIATLRGVQSETLAQTGDAEKFMLVAEKTLVVRNQKAHAVIFALS